MESFLQTLNPHSVLKDEDLSNIRGGYRFLNEVQLRLSLPNERADTVSEDGSASDEAGIELSVDDIFAIYYPQENSKDHGRYSMYPRRKRQVVGEMKNADRYWQDHYFFMHMNEKSMGGLANAFYPSQGAKEATAEGSSIQRETRTIASSTKSGVG
ncbi:hypothetical protein TIFTF001_040943 [Ficus carica]|uniref:Uncharacterized protein n=1 Tax=Ficus carica TaxID=3494 RepID=A0AA88CQF1_FICCA|nr:hypothetical protein TIFTF001_040925 [Ficus carica]GMN26909.1 hypothetical protein TIFTF001_040929 [Ficus carica]GMN26952.1 hypothetical protein TIFTF001_040939 [Ficus carica]GMN26965.1 hypothetical protein TIFTF001_040943 [Ficus carica]